MSAKSNKTVPLAIAGLGALAAGVGLLMRSQRLAAEASTATRIEAYVYGNTRIPARTRRWAPQIAKAVAELCPADLTPECLADATAWVIERESKGGDALRPPGPAGTGDFKARNWTPWPMPPDGLGWGRGLMQLDYWAHPEVREPSDWPDPWKNIRAGVRELVSVWNQLSTLDRLEKVLGSIRVPFNVPREQRRPLNDSEKAFARSNWGRWPPLQHVFNAYNAGVGNVAWALAQGIDPDLVSTDRYGGSVLANVLGYTLPLA